MSNASSSPVIKLRGFTSSRKTYSVTVGNIGQTYLGHDYSTANSVFEAYASDSCNGYGRASGEGVILWDGHEPIREQVATCPHI